MRDHHTALSALAVAFTFLLCIEPVLAQQDNSKIREAIAATNQKFEKALVFGDWAGLAALYTENGQLLPPNSDIVSGRQAIQEFWQGAFSSIGQASLETVEVAGQGDTAYEVGKYVLIDASRQLIDRGKYVVIWKYQDGQWKLHRDIWNSNLPAKGK